MRSDLHRASLAFGVLLLCPTLAFASRVRAINLEELTGRADRVLLARCLDVRVGLDRSLGQVVTRVRLDPERTAKGRITGPFTIKLLGNQTFHAPVGEAVEGIPRFREGERLVLFLHPDSRSGLTSPVGFGHGAFRVSRNRSGHDEAANAFGNLSLLDGLSPTAQQRLGSRLGQQRGRAAITVEALLDLVRSLDATR